MKILVSACLLGENCKYSGGNNYNQAVCDFARGHQVVPVCPEVLGGLPTPRCPAEIVQGVAKAFLHELMQRGREQGCNDLRLTCDPHNAAGIALYESLGMKPKVIQYQCQL